MKTKKLLACLLLALLLTITVLPTAFADMVFSGEDENLTGTHDATVFLAGENPVNSAEVNGIIFAAGNTVKVDGTGEYALVAGRTVTVSGSVSRDAFIAGESIVFTGTCERDMAVAGNNVEVMGSVARDLMIYGRNVVISGHVGGNVTIQAQTITITDDAEIEGKIRRNESAVISAPDETLSDVTVVEASPAEGSGIVKPDESKATSSTLSAVKSKLFSFVGLLLIALFMLWLTFLWEKVDARFAGRGFGFYAGTFGIGILVLIMLPILSVILMITGVGARPATVLLLIYAAALVASPIFLGFFLGMLLWRKAFKQSRKFWAELAIGLLLLTVLKAVPRMSLVLILISAPFGLGVLARLLGKKRSAAPASTSAASASTDLAVQTSAD